MVILVLTCACDAEEIRSESSSAGPSVVAGTRLDPQALRGAFEVTLGADRHGLISDVGVPALVESTPNTRLADVSATLQARLGAVVSLDTNRLEWSGGWFGNHAEARGSGWSDAILGWVARWTSGGDAIPPEPPGALVPPMPVIPLGGETAFVPVTASPRSIQAPMSSGPGLSLRIGAGSPIQLAPGVAGQTIDLFLRNDGARVEVGGLDLKIRLTGVTPGPGFDGVNLRAGTLFTTGNAMQGGDVANTATLQFWSVSINDPSAPPVLEGGGTSVRIGTLSLTTAGLSSGTWTLSANLPGTGLVDPFGDSLPMGVSGDVQVIVPEIESGLAVAAALFVVSVVRRGRTASGA